MEVGRIMIRKVLFVRHAHSGQKHGIMDDFLRPLSSRGMSEAAFMGEKLKKLKISPKKIIASSSIRTSATANIIAEKLGMDLTAIDKTDSIYESSPQEYLKVLLQQEPEIDFIMFVGHNPAITSLAIFWEIDTVGILPGEAFLCEGSAENWKEWLTEALIKGKMIK